VDQLQEPQEPAAIVKQPIVLLGSGKMARDIGCFFCMRGHHVTWYSAHAPYLAECEKYVTKIIRRMRNVVSEVPSVTFTDTISNQNDVPPVIIESTCESLDAKKKVLQAADERIHTPGALLLSNSSSLLPENIHPQCIGCHFFYPVELTGTIELIVSDSTDSDTVISARNFLATDAQLEIIEQNGSNAFAVNRLLLPLQNEVFKLLKMGYDPQQVDKASQSPYCAIGQLSLMDAVGFDVILSSVRNYLSHFTLYDPVDFLPFTDGLEQLLAVGKKGKKNNNGLLIGEPLPWERCVHSLPDDTGKKLQETFYNTCELFIAGGQMTKEELNAALTNVFGAEERF
jgi:3-hydroxybutyryl-CoA dehydrogenase